jgi:uncharacterized delta-60 repeat protein
MLTKRFPSYRGLAQAAALSLLAALLTLSTGTSTAASAAPAQHWRLDPGFGDGGIVRTDFPVSGPHYAWGFETAVQPNGRTLVAGVATSQVSQLDWAAVARYRPDGSLDPTFGAGGQVLIGPHAFYQPSAMALQEVDGQLKILLAVATTMPHPLRYRCSVVRLNPDGSLDTDHDADPGVMFGHEGIKVVAFPGNSGFCGGLTVTPDNDIVVTVRASSNAGDVGVFELLGDDGALDPAFGTDGEMTISAPGYQVPEAVVLQAASGGQPKIVIGGLTAARHGYDWALWRLAPDGRLDTTFGRLGYVVTAMRDARVETSYDSVAALTVASNGDLVAAGDYRAWPKGRLLPQDTAAAAEYLPDGRLDTTFGVGGRAHIPWDGRGEADATGVTLDETGDIVFAGPFMMPTSGRFLVGGFTAAGQPDPQFGATGYQELVVGGGYDAGESLSLDPSGRLVVAGIAGDPGEGGHDLFGVVRFKLTGAS